MRAYYSDSFVLPLPPGHRFPMEKYARLRARVVAELPPGAVQLELAPAASDADILRAHDMAWLQAVVTGTLSPKQQRDIGFPWSEQMVERSRRSSGATVAACRAALEDGTAVNLAGGTHHAFRDHGGGYCVFNDAAIAATAMQACGHVQRVVVVDCDVHQGDGTASILAGDASVFTFSIHGRNNYPFVKQSSDLDIELDDGTGDDEYLERLAGGLDHALAAARAGLAIYLAGADPYEGDRLGRLSLSRRGLAERDRLVFGRCAAAGLPVAACMAGGYAHEIDETVDIHLQTVRLAAGC
ncbi:MAG: histone deacetylase [Burkholderiales bacterium]|nr:histone deacetylase [Burkholderiales bacterium]